MKKLNIAIIGLGNIGTYLYRYLKNNKKILTEKNNCVPEITYVSAKNKKRKRSIKINKKQWLNNYLDATKNKDIDLIVELIGGAEGPAKKLVFSALKNKKHVVTANKALIAKYGDQLAKIAEKNKVNLEFEAAVAGGIPIVRSIKEGLTTNKINKVFGILNGTTNYILSEMEKTGESFDKVLKKAQRLGYAEPGNPKLDLNGFDAFAKVRILSALSFNCLISRNVCIMEGIENIDIKDIKIANQLNLRIKLLGISEIVNGKLFETVHPCLVSKNTYIGNVNGVMNAVIVHGKPVGESILQGEGAGPGPTSSSLLSDLISILRGNVQSPFGISFNKRKKMQVLNNSHYTNSLYLRFEVKDKPGVLSRITNRFAKFRISVKRIIQTPDKKNRKATIVIITHKTSEINAKNCLSIFRKNRDILKFPTLIRLYN